MARKLRPEIASEWWLAAPSPDLDLGLIGEMDVRQRFGGPDHPEKDAPVDHHAFQDGSGVWHLWACVRSTSVGRVLYRWEADEITMSPWRLTGDVIRADRSVGESQDSGDECIQSPYIVHHDGLYYMFYGGGARQHGSRDWRGLPVYQMCLMTSADGHNWVRHRNSSGESNVFIGPGGVRDPCVVRIGVTWHIYYCANFEETGWTDTIAVRTSSDLINWSEPRSVHEDRIGFCKTAAAKTWAECPSVLEREGYFYLFRTLDYYEGETDVFRSDDPFDFGVGDVGSKHVCRIHAAAPEIYDTGGECYISSSHNPPLGEQIARLRWVEDV